MNRGWVDRIPRSLAVGLAVAIAASSLLSAHTSEDKNDPAAQSASPPTAAQSSEQTTGEEPAQTSESRAISGLIGSKHDFSEGGTIDRDLCTPCHTPHLVAAPRPKLDRREQAAEPLQPYEGVELELTGWSLMCLGCHDGTTAPDVYSSAHAIDVSHQLGDWQFGSAGLRSHPVGVKYPPANDEDFNSPAAVEAAGLTLPDGRIQCTTCHDPHNTENHRGMLRISNRRSRVCLTCHRR